MTFMIISHLNHVVDLPGLNINPVVCMVNVCAIDRSKAVVLV